MLMPEQLAKFVLGLAASGHPFLFSTRNNMVRGSGTTALPAKFIAATAGRCRLTTWCPQEQVLSYRAVGCFVTYSRWNSMCENIATGVPMVCWPGFADHYTNCKYACEAWGIGVQPVGRVDVWASLSTGLLRAFVPLLGCHY
ncbi:hypothetical protein E2562_000371 [Oryza meyeriana var. granulata]|uniref:Exostosin GT47 domain-containing protein n=1 Tax=Oryza meyeriana var. granulata TaxID=110450 RepID=A0A6G1CDE7_9ORYZ|nr:hypothetical protein E2562_000371 [Oryza meyeriana var. granulata]